MKLSGQNEQEKKKRESGDAGHLTSIVLLLSQSGTFSSELFPISAINDCDVMFSAGSTRVLEKKAKTSPLYVDSPSTRHEISTKANHVVGETGKTSPLHADSSSSHYETSKG